MSETQPSWKAKRRTIFLALAGVVLVGGLALFLWPHKQTPYRLKLVRQEIEQGKSVAWFRIEGGDRPRITDTRLLIGQELQTPLFWESHTPDDEKPRNEFAVIVPTNAPVWQLQVSVQKDTTTLRQRVTLTPTVWRTHRSEGFSFIGSSWFTVKWFTSYNILASGVVEFLQSDPITNSVPHTL